MSGSRWGWPVRILINQANQCIAEGAEALDDRRDELAAYARVGGCFLSDLGSFSIRSYYPTVLSYSRPYSKQVNTANRNTLAPGTVLEYDLEYGLKPHGYTPLQQVSATFAAAPNDSESAAVIDFRARVFQRPGPVCIE